ncbi:hypothetical protein [Bacillus coahuilensis]|uniref:hypothetical protein n=1 Tax=Bacillus coahuilensis TaxID=408580 RepID=UPI001ED91000|nr:hypothetical protein [Bacillus coahuilensis]
MKTITNKGGIGKMIRSNRMEQRTKEEWLTLVDTTLKGKSSDVLNKRIHTTYSTKPLYTQEDIENIPVDELPGQGLSTRGFTKSSNNWINVNPSDLSRKARENQDSLSLTSQEIKEISNRYYSNGIK